jgi:arylsulfatase A-like enzyme
MMTGLLPHNHGVLQVEHCVDDDQSVLRVEHPHWAQHLSSAGYLTGFFGKWHVERTNRVEDFGWQVNGTDLSSSYRALGQGPAKGEEKLLQEENLVRYETLPRGYSPVMHYGVTDVPGDRRPFGIITQMAGEFLAKATKESQPWVCCASFAEPNTPLIAGREAFESYDIDAIRLPENLHDDFSDRPNWYRRQQEIFDGITPREWQECRAVYYALVSELDQQCGKLIDQLEVANALENTIVVIVGDHGRYLGAHGFDAHNFGPFEEAYNIPLVMSGPGFARGKTTKALVGFQDLGPTLLELTGSQPIDVPDSRSFAPVLTDPEGTEENYRLGYAETHGTRFTLQQRILWQDHWKFVFNGFDYDELYNLQEDPHEMHNLARDPDQQERIESMMKEIWRIIRDTNDRALLETHYAPMRIASIGPTVLDE